MPFPIRQKYKTGFLFPAALFFVSAILSLGVLLSSARICRSTAENSAGNYTAGTGLSYISERIHQNDRNGAVSLGTFDGCEAFIIKQMHENETYYTYIYAYEQTLRELFVKSGVNAGAADGKAILEIQDFSVKQIADGLFAFSCTDKKNQTASSVIGVRSAAARDGL